MPRVNALPRAGWLFAYDWDRIALESLQARGATVRRLTQYWTLDGQLLAEVDPYPEAGESGAAS